MTRKQESDQYDRWAVTVPIKGEAVFTVYVPRGSNAQDAYRAAMEGGKSPDTGREYEPETSWEYEEDERIGAVAYATGPDGFEYEVGDAWIDHDEEGGGDEEP